MEFRQYDVYVFDPEPAKGHEIRKIRPCAIISPDELNRHLATVIIAPVTTKFKSYPFRPAIRLENTSGTIMLDQIRCVDKTRLRKRIGRLSPQTIASVKSILDEMLVR